MCQYWAWYLVGAQYDYWLSIAALIAVSHGGGNRESKELGMFMENFPEDIISEGKMIHAQFQA